MDAKRIEELLAVYRDGLLKDVVPFWSRNIDPEFGGIMTITDADGTVIDTDKGGWQQGRAGWMFSTFYNTVEKRPEWLAAATSLVGFIDKHVTDTDGRMFFHLTRDGKPIRKTRYLYTEMFAMIAYGAYAKASGKAEYADKARDLYKLVKRYATTPGLIAPKFTETRPAKAIGFPMIMMVTCQVLRDTIGGEEWTREIDACIAEVERDFVKPELKVCMEVVAPDGSLIDHTDGRTLNPGHAIEAAWFIMHEGHYRKDARLIKLGCQILDWMWERGWDKEYGGILYFRDLKGLPVQEYWQDMKFWWPHNEAIIATLLAWALTGEAKYATWHGMVHDWSYKHFPDKVNGEWFGYLHRDGRLSTPVKGNLFKGMFHLPRMQLYCWKLLEGVKAGAEGYRV
jgi:N-acylglucosamine 2-epimerase